MSKTQTDDELVAEIAALKQEIERLDRALELMDERIERGFDNMDSRVRWLRDNAEVKQ